MNITSATLSRAAGVAAAAAGLIFIGVQVGHPHLDATSVVTTEVVVRNSLKVVMAALALVGLTGMYLRQVKQTGVLGLVGYVVISLGYLLMMGTAYTAAFVLPEVATTMPGYVDAVTAAASGRATTGDLGLLAAVFKVQEFGYLAGGLLFGIALFRARVFPRWASAMLAAGGAVTVVLALMPDAFYRLLAFPNGIAMIALGYSLWRSTRTTRVRVTTGQEQCLTTAGAR
jgi:hypothetical protein